MSTLNKIIFALLTAVALTGCNFLNKQPFDLTKDNYFNSAEELNAFLVSVYSPLSQEPFYGNFFAVHTAGGDDLSFFQRSSGHTGIMMANTTANDVNITTLWRLLYDGINRANLLLEGVNKNTETIDSITRSRVRAEALFLRSFYYFTLVQGWGDVPYKTQPAEDVHNLSMPRTDKQLIYDSIIKDMIAALPYLRTADEVNPGYITQSAAKGILARVYMFRAGEHFRDKLTPDADKVKQYFSEAKKWALEVRESGKHGLVPDYSRVFSDLAEDKYNSTQVKESIWEAEMAGNWLENPVKANGRIGNVIGFGAGSMESKLYSTTSGIRNPGFSYDFVYASLKLYNMYEAANDSVRFNWNIAPYRYILENGEVKERRYYSGKRPAGLTEVDGVTCTEETLANSNNNKTRCAGKYRRELEVVTPKNKNYTPINFPILRYSDVLLMIAEAENEINATPTQLAYDCLNEVRSRAKIQAYTMGDLTQETFRQTVKDERAMELCFEAIRRWDLIRWGDFYNEMQDMRTMPNQPGWTVSQRYAANYYNVSEAYNYFPIPSLEMSVNKLITSNNPGW